MSVSNMIKVVYSIQPTFEYAPFSGANMVSKAHCAPSTQPGEWLVICRPSANLLTLVMQPLNTSCKAQHALRQPHPGEYSGAVGEWGAEVSTWRWWWVAEVRSIGTVWCLNSSRNVELRPLPGSPLNGSCGRPQE